MPQDPVRLPYPDVDGALRSFHDLIRQASKFILHDRIVEFLSNQPFPTPNRILMVRSHLVFCSCSQKTTPFTHGNTWPSKTCSKFSYRFICRLQLHVTVTCYIYRLQLCLQITGAGYIYRLQVTFTIYRLHLQVSLHLHLQVTFTSYIYKSWMTQKPSCWLPLLTHVCMQ